MERLNRTIIQEIRKDFSFGNAEHIGSSVVQLSLRQYKKNHFKCRNCVKNRKKSGENNIWWKKIGISYETPKLGLEKF